MPCTAEWIKALTFLFGDTKILRKFEPSAIIVQTNNFTQTYFQFEVTRSEVNRVLGLKEL